VSCKAMARAVVVVAKNGFQSVALLAAVINPLIASVIASNSPLKGVGCPDKQGQTVDTFWQGELASFRVTVFGAWRPQGLVGYSE